jgi:hypothetical protein
MKYYKIYYYNGHGYSSKKRLKEKMRVDGKLEEEIRIDFHESHSGKAVITKYEKIKVKTIKPCAT